MWFTLPNLFLAAIFSAPVPSIIPYLINELAMSNESWDEKLAAQEARDESEDDRQYHDAALAVAA